MSAHQLALLLIPAALIAAALFLFLPTQRSRKHPGPSADRQSIDAVFRDDDRYWSGGVLYNNPDDLAVFVPKRFGLGWTVNIGRPQGKLFLVGTLLLPVALALLGILFPGLNNSYGCHLFSGCHLLP
jgi:uncharacterized membrane protein